MYSYSYSYPRGRRRSFSRADYETRLPPPQRATRRSSRFAVRGDVMDTNVLGRRREDAKQATWQKASLDAGRYIAPMLSGRFYEKARVPVAAPAASDRRQFHPADPIRPLVTAYGVPARVGAAALAVRGELLGAKHFARHLNLHLCVQRRVRREVLFAFGRHGGGHRPPRRKSLSNIRC